MKKSLILFVALASLLLIGAGCEQADKNVDNKADDITELSLGTTDLESSLANKMETSDYHPDFVLFAKAIGPNTVEFSWTVPSEVDTTNGFRILSSSRPEPVLPSAYWDWIVGNKTEATLNDVISGTRYFRVCQWLGDECGLYSNEIQLEVE